MQGETLSSLLCTNSVDKIGEESDVEPHKYRNKSIIPQMSFVDDIVDVKKCGTETKLMNQYTTEQVNLRKLQLNKDKCARMHIKSKSKEQNECEAVFIDEWSVKKVKEGSKNVLRDQYEGKSLIKTVNEYTYLGDKILPDGSNRMTINDRISKGKGIARDILQVLEGTYFGEHHFEAFTVLRNSMLYSVLTYNLEVSHNLFKK